MAVAVACGSEVDPPPPPTPIPDFRVEIDDVTRSTVTVSVAPSEKIANYICVVEERSVVDEFTQNKFIIATVFQ